MIGAHRRATTLAAVSLALAATMTPAPAVAQDGADARLRRLEAEVRALQRKIFPGGSDRFFEAEIQPAAPRPDALPPTAGPLTDLLAKVDAIEAQLQRLTAQIEETGNRTRLLERRVGALEGGVGFGEGSAAGRTETGAETGGATGGAGAAVGSGRNPIAVGPASGSAFGPGGTAGAGSGSSASGQRLAAVQAIVKPDSGDAGDDAYVYGFRLWEANFFPEAVQQLQATVAKYPRHPRISFARNLLGRALLDDGKPGTAAQVFLENYQADRRGARAPDSLLYLAIAMTRLKENQRACVALQELAEVYPQEVGGRLAQDYAAARKAATCN